MEKQMANNVVAQVVGGDKKVLDNVSTLSEVKSKLGYPTYTGSINGEPAADHDDLDDGDFVSLSQPIKAGC